MQNKNHYTKISKFLSLVLRHKPETIGLKLDPNGWADVNALLNLSNEYGIKIDLTTLRQIVETNDKKRFAFNHAASKIRANQGHSVNIDIDLESKQPPEILYHGTATRFLDAILNQGLKRMNRQHVHLSDNLETAINVGR
ncbi:MAG: RNA 2'-phosphotransferase, partial [Bacteroidota bacterium]